MNQADFCKQNPLLIYGISVVISLIFVYGIAFFCQDSVAPWSWSPELKKYVIPDGHVHYMRSEGWATSRIGKLGIAGVRDITILTGNKIAVWGDSHVEAWQVDDEYKVPQVLTRLFASSGLSLWQAFGIGQSGSAIADYYFAIPKYEKLIKNVKAHVIIITQPNEDILPNQALENHSRFLYTSAEGYLFKEERYTPVFISLKQKLHSLHLDFIWTIMKKIPEMNLRFSLSGKNPLFERVGNNGVADPVNGYDQTEAFDYLLQQMKKRTIVPIIMVYAPSIPEITKDGVVTLDNHALIMKTFAKRCQLNGIKYLDVSDEFVQYHVEIGQFPRGFMNSGPGKGHFNKAGHALVAQSIYKYLIENNIVKQ